MEKGLMSGYSEEAYKTFEALTKTRQHKFAIIEDSSGNILTESTFVLNRWIEYCSSLCNNELYPDTSLLQSNQTPTRKADSLPVLREEVEVYVSNLKAGKFLGVDNSPSKEARQQQL